MINEETAESISAIEQYIAKNKTNVDRHEANVLVHAEGKDHGCGKRFVFATVHQGVGKVTIEDLNTIYSNCTNIFSTQNAIFTFLAGTLCIKTKDVLGVEISINIS